MRELSRSTVTGALRLRTCHAHVTEARLKKPAERARQRVFGRTDKGDLTRSGRARIGMMRVRRGLFGFGIRGLVRATMHGFTSLSQVAMALRGRWKWALLVAAALLTAIIAVCAVFPRVYTATSVIVFNTRGSDAIVDKNDTLSFNAYVNGEVDLIASRRVMQRAAADPTFLSDPLTRAQIAARKKGMAPEQDWLADFVAAHTQVTAAKNVRTVSIAVESDDARFAALAANTIARAYLATSLELRVSPARSNVQFFRARKAERAGELAEAQSRLDAFVRKTGLTGYESRTDADDLQLRTLAERLSAARVEQAGASAANAVGNVGVAVSAGQITNPVISQLRQEIAVQSAALRDMTVLSGPNYPTVVQARARLDELQSQLAAEIVKAAQGIARQSAATTQESERIGALEAAKRRALSAGAADRSRLEVLNGDVARAKANYDAVAARLAELELQSTLESPNAAILSPARAPRSPSFPNWPLVIATGSIAALLVGAIAALCIELAYPRVRSREDLEALLGGAPVLCDLTA